MRYVKGFGRFWYEFIVGDDWKVAFAVVSALALGAIFVGEDVGVGGDLLVPLVAAGVVVAFIVSLLVDVRGLGR